MIGVGKACRARAWSLGLSVGLLLAPLPARAQDTTIDALGMRFNPHFFLGYEYTDNARYLGEEGENSDSILRAGVSLPLVRPLRKGSFSLGYAGTYEKHESFESLDNFSHRLRLNVSTSPRPRSSFSFGLSYSKLQDQGNALDDSDLDLFLTRRSDRESMSANASFRGPVTRHFGWHGDFHASTNSFEPISGFDETEDLTSLEDRRSYRTGLGFYRERVEGNSLGLSYEARIFDLDVSGEETVHLLSIRIERSRRPGRSLSLSFGGFVRDDDSTEEVARGTESGAQGAFRMAWQLRRVNVGLTATHSPTAGGARRGTASNSTVGLSIGGTASRNWGWSAATRYAMRDPTADDQAEVESVALSFSARRLLGRNVSLSARGSWIDQKSDAALDQGSYYRAGLSLAVHRQQRGSLAGGF